MASSPPQRCHCAHGCVSRRQFLSRVGALAGAGALQGLASGAYAYDLGTPVDAASLRPHPKVNVTGAVLRFPLPYWLGWPGTSYDVEGHSAEYISTFTQSAAGLGVDLATVETPIENDAGLNEFMGSLDKRRPDAVLLILQHIGCWGWVDRVAAMGIPTIVFSPVGTSFTGHVKDISRRPGVHVVSSLEVDAVTQAMRMVRCKRQLEETRLLIVSGGERRETVLPGLGVKVRYVPRRIFREVFDRMPVTDEVKAVAEDFKRRADRIVEPDAEDRLNAAKAFVTAKSVMVGEEANAISMDCLGMVGARIVPTPPCMAWSTMQDVGVTAGCEADLFGALSLMFVSYLLDRPGYMNDPVAETAKNRLIASHCTSGTRLRGFDEDPVPLILRHHSESDLGVSPQILWPVGEPCSLVSFTGPGQVIVDTGTVEGNIDTPPAGGCRTSVEISMDRIEDARDVLGFHQVVTWGDHRRAVDAYAQMYGLDVIHSPERAPESERGQQS